MKIKLLFLLACSHLAIAQAPAIEWQKSYGGSNDDILLSCMQTADGGLVGVGHTISNDGQVTGSHGNTDCWVIKTDASGVLQWQRTLGGSSQDLGTSIVQTADSGYIISGSSSSSDGDLTLNYGTRDAWIIKLNASGGIEWQRSYGGSGLETATDIIQTADLNYVFVATANSSDFDVIGNHGLTDIWVVKLDATGTIINQKSLGGSGQELSTHIAMTTDGGYIISGNTSSTDGDVTNNTGQVNYWIIKLDSNLQIQWEKNYGNAVYDDTAVDIKQTSDGGYVVTGEWQTDVATTHTGILKLNSSGDIEWQTVIGGSVSDTGVSILQTSDGGYITANFAWSGSGDGDVDFNHGESDIWVVKLTGAGAIVWQRSLGSSGPDSVANISQAADGGYIISGSASADDGDVTENFGNKDFWIVKLAADPLLVSNFTAQKMALYPNPAQNAVRLMLPGGLIPDSINIIDNSGKIVGQHSNTEEISVEKLAAGLYFIQATSEHGVYISKLVKQ